MVFLRCQQHAAFRSAEIPLPPPPPEILSVIFKSLRQNQNGHRRSTKREIHHQSYIHHFGSTEKRKTKRRRTLGTLGHHVPSWTSVWNSCFNGPSLGRENEISFLISHRVFKTGTYLEFQCNMTVANELCTICNTPEDIERLFLNCTPAAHTWEHFLPLLNKVFPLK